MNEGEPGSEDFPLSTNGDAAGEGRSTGAATPDGRPVRDGETRRFWFELIAVLCLAVVPDIVHAVLAFSNYGPADGREFGAESYYWMIVLRSFQVAAPVLYIMWRSSDGWEHFGIVRPDWIDPAVGIVVFLICTFALWPTLGYVLVGLMYGSDVADWTIPDSPVPPPLIPVLALAITSGFAEELVMRGYLIPRLQRLFNSTFIAVLLSSLLFAAYHIYQGWAAAIFIGIEGIIFGVTFVLTRRLWPVVITHILMDAMLLYPT